MSLNRSIVLIGLIGFVALGDPAARAQTKRPANAPTTNRSNPATSPAVGKPSGGTRSMPAADSGNAGGQRVASGQRLTANPAGLAPEWYPLPKEDQQYIDEVLEVWQRTSGKIERYRCNFTRWIYNPAFGPYMPDQDGRRGPLLPQTRDSGRICFKAPDKGMFKVEKMESCVPPKVAGKKETWTENENAPVEHWVCDGESIFEFDHINKILKQQKLPPELRGKQIINGPLPFFFGVNAQQIKDRFWVRPLASPKGAEDEVWLEAVPKTRQDSADYALVRVVLDQKTVLPKALLLLGPDGSNTNFAFTDCERNWNELVEKVKHPFEKQFYQPSIPSGYRKVVEELPVAGAVQGPQAPPAGPQAKKAGRTIPR